MGSNFFAFGNETSKFFEEKSPLPEPESLKKRGWEDFRKMEGFSAYETGAFSAEESKIVNEALKNYAIKHCLNSNELAKLVSEPLSSKILGVWTEVAQCLPNRSVCSVQNFCRRRFNPNNYRGRWTTEEVAKLIQLVKEKGRKWVEIGHELTRTSTNVRDKWKQIGGENHRLRQQSRVWNFADVLKLVRLIEKSQHKILLDTYEDSLIAKSYEFFYKEILDESNTRRRKYGGHILRNQAQQKAIEAHILPSVKEGLSIPWSSLAREIVNKSVDDCRNKWAKLIPNNIFKIRLKKEENVIEIDEKSDDNCGKTSNSDRELEEEANSSIKDSTKNRKKQLRSFYFPSQASMP